MTGIVRDQTGATIPNANISIKNESTGLERRATTTQEGYYIVTNLPPGLYTVMVEAAGFKKYESKNNKLDASVTATVDLSLTVGQQTETVEVIASTPQVQADSATVGRVVTTQQIENLPLNGRNPLFLAQLKAGVRRGSSMAGFSFGLNSGGFAINGSRGQDNLITFDGAPAIRTRANGDSIGTADADMIQEIQVLTANYNAEYGRAAGGQIRMVTKSGGRQFHGNFYEYLRNEKLDANSWTRNRAGQAREINKFNQFGYNFSGPVYIPKLFNKDRNKLFFVWSQEYVIRRRTPTNTPQVVPSAAMRRGDFSELLSPNTFFSGTRVINDPSTGQPFPGNIIPASRLSANGIAFLNTYPTATPGFQQGAANYIATRPNPEDQHKDSIAIDYLPAEKHSIRARYNYFIYESTDAFRADFDYAVSANTRPNHTGSLNYIWTLGPTLINEALATASADRVRINVLNNGRYQRDQYGINYPYVFADPKQIGNKIPTIAINGLGTIDGGPYPSSSAGPIYTLSDTLTWIKGSHTLKAGFYFERSGQNDFDQINVTGVPGGTNNQNGRFVFTDGRANGTGLSVANAALGLFDTYAEIGTRAYTPYRGQMVEGFAQDSWKASDKLRLEYGVRWTYETPYYYSLWNNIAVFDPNRYDPSKAAVVDPVTGSVSGERFNGVLIPGNGWPDAAKGRVAIADSGQYNYLFGGDNIYPKKHFKYFSPRLGVAYSVNDKTVVRVGGGRFIARTGVSDEAFLGGNPPFQPMASISNGNADNPVGGNRNGFPQFFMTIDPNFKLPEAWNWSGTVERQLPGNLVVSIGYVGRTGLHLERVRDINALQAGTIQANPGRAAVSLRPYKGFANINLAENAARSEYNGLQLELNRRFATGLQFGFAYTLSKSMDNGSDRRAKLYDNFNDRSFWGPSDFDTRHMTVINVVYQLPWLKNNRSLAGQTLGGWQVTTVAQFQTGAPTTLGRGDDIAGVDNTNTQPWDINAPLAYSKSFSEGATSGQYWVNVRDSSGNLLVTRPAAGTFSTKQTRNTIYQPGFQNWNLALFKTFSIFETQRLMFRAESFNFINHPNLGGESGGSLVTDPTSSTFGMVTTKGGNRNIQLSLRYSF